MKETVQEAMKASFKPEFLNRIDEIVVFKQLTKDQVAHVADIMLGDVYARLEKQGIALEVTAAFKDKLINHGWNPIYGARPLRRAINTMLEDALSDCVLRGDIASGDSITVDVDESGSVIVLGRQGVINRQAAATLVPAGIA
jgi:ATP-dependent Clp protease ATP-binding subunit ClpC